MSQIGTLRRLAGYTVKYYNDLIRGIIALLTADALALIIPWIIKEAIDLLPQRPATTILIRYSGLILIVAIFQGVFRFYWRKHLFTPSRKVECDLRNDYFAHLQRLSWSFFQHTKTGDIMSRATNDLTAVRELLGFGVLIIVDTIVTVSTCLILMIIINVRLTLLILLPLPILSFIVYRIIGGIRNQFKDVQVGLSNLSTIVQESISGIRVVQAYVCEESTLERFKRINQEYIRKNLSLTKIRTLLPSMMIFIAGLTAVIVLWIGGRDVITGRMSLGAFVAFNSYLAMLTWPMMATGYVINLIQRGIAAMERIEEFLDIKPEMVDRDDKLPITEIKGEIEFKDLNFSYYPDRGDVLHGINLKIKKGSITALVGPVGSGKSTLVKLIPRIYDIDGVGLTVDGVEIKRIPIDLLRKSIGYVEQEPLLFSDTIRENILFGAHDGASDEDIWKAASISGLSMEIERFPNGMDTLLGERGVTLSGGQRQRLALARVILRRPKILILDDAFASLDAQMEEKVLREMKKVMKGITTIMISHRISTIKDADMIVVLDQGRIAEVGDHKKLISIKGIYQNIYRQQMLGLEMELV